MHNDTSIEGDSSSPLFTAFLVALANQFINGLVYIGFIPYQFFPLVSLFSLGAIILVTAHMSFSMALLTALACRLPLVHYLNQGDILSGDIPVIVLVTLECLLIVMVIKRVLKRKPLADSSAGAPLFRGLVLIQLFNELFLGYLVYGLWSAGSIWAERTALGMDVHSSHLAMELMYYLNSSVNMLKYSILSDYIKDMIGVAVSTGVGVFLAMMIEKKYFTKSTGRPEL